MRALMYHSCSINFHFSHWSSFLLFCKTTLVRTHTHTRVCVCISIYSRDRASLTLGILQQKLQQQAIRNRQVEAVEWTWWRGWLAFAHLRLQIITTHTYEQPESIFFFSWLHFSVCVHPCVYVGPETLEVWWGWMGCVTQRELNPHPSPWSGGWRGREGPRGRSLGLLLFPEGSLEHTIQEHSKYGLNCALQTQ